MKKQLLFLAVLFCSVSLFAQVGNGIELQIAQDYQFSPTTTDSTSSVTITIYNTVASDQEITFTGLEAPFYMSDTELTVLANDSLNFVLNFTPSGQEIFSDVLEFSGNIFGSGALNISGEGVQVSISTSTDSLNLGTTAVDEMISSSITVYNNGNGTMEITDIISNNPDFTTSHSSAMISEGGSLELDIDFQTLVSGQSTSTISIYSNDPDFPVYNILLQATAVSELSGSLCGTLNSTNSPYYLVGNLSVSDTCSLVIEAGVVINCDSNDLTINGSLHANGSEMDSIYINDFSNLYLQNSSSNDSINYVRFDSDESMIIIGHQDISFNNCFINSTSILNNFEPLDFNFEDGLPQNWSTEGSNLNLSNNIAYGYNNSSGLYLYTYDYDASLITNSHIVNANQSFSCMFKYSWGEPNCHARFYYKLNNENWVQFWNQNNNGTDSWQSISHSIPSEAGDLLQIKLTLDVYNTSNGYDEISIYLDDVDFGASTFPTIKSETTYSNCLINSDISTSNDLIIMNSIVNSKNAYSISSHRGEISINNSGIIGGSIKVIDSRGDDININIENTTIKDGGLYGVHSIGDNVNVIMNNSTLKECGGDGIYLNGNSSEVDLKYSFVKDNNGVGISTNGDFSHVNLSSSMITGNGSYGIQSSGQVNLNYSNITFNADDGIYLTGNNFSNLTNSIIWGNDYVNYTQINTSSGVTSISYSTVQGSGAYGTSGSQYYFGDGSIDDDPVFEDSLQHMSSFSNCVDAGTPWESDANMPYGLGGVRADIGIYGGPDNWFWGGTAVPDGAVNISSVEDKPQDQGGNVGVVFDASVWDNADLVNNVTSYAVWRHFDPEGGLIDTVSQGSWELVAEMPAQSFESYAITAESLGDSTILNGEFNTCFVVVAKTDDDDVFWYSNVACGYSTDDIAPLYPVGMLGSYNFDDGLRLSWEFPTEDDYLETNIYQDGVLVGTTSDNNFYDESADAGSIYDYTLEHLDSSGNPSDQGALEVSALLPNWNPVITSKTHHIAVPRNFSISTTNDPVERGDFLGVFHNNSGVLECGGMVQWSDQDVVLTAFGDSEEMSGFNTNETFVWRFWDASKDEYYFANVTYDASLPNDANFIEDGLSALQSIEIYAKQDINLNQGWSMVSSYVLEDELLMSSLMAPVTEDIVIMKDENGLAYWPSYNFNQIGDLSDEKGYKLLIDQSHQITFTGRKVIPNEKVLNLQQGWQIIPYLRESSAAVDAVFEDISESIIIVKDDLGQVYWPEWGINSIGNMNPGEGYQIKMTDNINFNYQANAIEMPLEMRMQDVEPEYYNVSNITESNMTIGIPLDAWEVLPNVMDEIAVCDLQDRVMGSAVFNGDNMVISVWANDEHGSMKSGLNEGEYFQIKHRDMSNNASYILNASAWQQGSNEFFEDEIAIVSWIEQGELIDQGFNVYPVLPNPSRSEAQIQLFSPESELVSIELYNVLGELVYIKELNVQEGMSLYTLPSYKFVNGTYKLKVQSADFIDVQSIQILK